ncbi:flagellar filament capping protein FliD [Celerinatantimonas diazotrophica]|uniref:Flagellar hook-associated protein 2 n=1 Tax=Celerinatantimonas diazotrophica TaxID=412034 RepID=A0A4V2PPT0_9GAMM|nr:flagellar filament capping protein FliD [Celerinatantimonas diazotrophica]TCK52161.1 flagellar hook-associated protein 2 [Celerinatantimonas diazotrophica]CAG9296134.1 B-type flagellar hook-associated protein 2 [Celerinatantimonas diazotrophica]
MAGVGAGLTAAGVGSGLDLESLMNASINAERQPQEQRIRKRKDTLNVTLSAVGSVKSALSNFRKAVDKATNPQEFLPRQALVDGQKVSGATANSANSKSSDKDKKSSQAASSLDDLAQPYKVSLSRRAVNGTYQVDVLQLAQGSRLTSTNVYKSGTEQIYKASTSPDKTPAPPAQLVFKVGQGSKEKSFHIDVKPGMTIEQLRKAINENTKNFGVTANLINSENGTHFVLDSSVSGLDNDDNPDNGNPNDLVVTTTSAKLANFVSNFQTTKTASGAKVRINGLDATSDTNQFKNVISGVSLTVHEKTSKSSQLTIEPDIDAAVKNVHNFVDTYNKVLTQIDKYSKPQQVHKGSDNSHHKPLSGDAMLRTMRYAMGKIVSSGVRDPEQPGRVHTLYGMGVKMDREGKLSVDDTKLKEQLNGDLNQVGRFFASDDGIATRFAKFVKSYEETGGILDHRQQSVQSRLKGVSEDQTALDDRMAQYEKTLRDKYTAFDKSMAGLKEQMNYVQSHL